MMFFYFDPVNAPPNKKRAWSWSAYIEEEKAIAVPVKLFKEVLFSIYIMYNHVVLFICCFFHYNVLWFVLQHQSFPQSRNSFKVGMKLEGLDPCHPSLFCVLTVAEVVVLLVLYGCCSPDFYLSLLICNKKFHFFYLCWLYACCLIASQIQGYRVRLHFDGYPECYDFWANADSWDLKPAGWCEKNGHKLLLPKGSHTNTLYHDLKT